MITPTYLDQVVQGTATAVNHLEMMIINRIARRIMDGYTFNNGVALIPSTITDIHKLIDNGALLQDVEDAVVNALPDIEDEIRDAFQNSAAQIGRANDALMQTLIVWVDAQGVQHGLTTPVDTLQGLPLNRYPNLTAVEKRQLETAYRRTNGTMRNMTQTTMNAANVTAMRALDDAYLKTQAGISPNTAIIEALDEMGNRGITAVAYGGRVERAETAIPRAVRTGINQAAGDVSITRCAEMGIGYVRTSSHLGARVTDKNDYTNHAWWQGQVFSVDWNNPVLAPYMAAANANTEQYAGLEELRDAIGRQKDSYPDFIESCGYGDVQGICGANCRHTFTPFIPGVNNLPTIPFSYQENEERYHETQTQRAMERAMRSTKRRMAAVEPMRGTPEGKEAYDALKRRLYVQDDNYRAFCKEKNLPMQNFRRYVI